MSQQLINLFSWKTLVALSLWLIYALPCFIFLDITYLFLAKKKRLQLDSGYYKWHKKYGLVKTSITKIALVILFYFYATIGQPHKPIAIVLFIALYIYYVVKLIKNYHSTLQRRYLERE